MNEDDDKLEIFEGKKWHRVKYYIFRSWAGKRRMNGKAYSGPRYYLGTNALVTADKAEEHTGCEHLHRRGLIPPNSSPDAVHPSHATTQRVNFISVEYDVPVDWARAAIGLAYTTSVILLARPNEEIQRHAMIQAYVETFSLLNPLLVKPLSDEKLLKLLLACWEQAQDYLSSIHEGRVDVAAGLADIARRRGERP